MNKAWVLLLSICCCSTLLAVSDIEFVDGTSPGAWYYDGSDTFSFIQPITISDVEGSGTDTLNGQFVHLPNLEVSGYTDISLGMATATITPQGPLQIWDTPDLTGTINVILPPTGA